jgi:hypothetical protein
MSGHGNGGGGGGGVPDGPRDCATLIFTATLNSPDPAVIATLKPAEVLDVVLDQGPPLRVLANTRNAHTAGSITSSQVGSLVGCIKQGYAYVAVVTSINGGACDVQVRPA